MEFHEIANIFPMMLGEDYRKLKDDIAENGQLEPIIIHEGKILDGRNRYTACKDLGIDVKYENFEGDDPFRYVISKNLRRRHLDTSQRALVAARMANMQVGDTSYNLRNVDSANLQSRENMISQSEAAEMLNVSPRIVASVKAIENNNPEFIPYIESGIMTVNEAEKGIKKQERAEYIEKQKQDISSNLFQPPNGIFDVVVIDPPWDYGTKYDPNGRRAANPYPEMSLEDIKNIMGMININDDCVLWLWTTHKFMRYSFDILDSWGFRDVAILTWVKDRMGLGSWLRSQSEFCIMAVKGSPKVNLTNQTTVLNAPMREHSRKPDEFYEMVEKLCIGYKVDWFSREERKGWAQFGNDTEKFTK